MLFKQAPGEADAELALLNRAGYLDTIYTDDSDLLVFGALNVLQRYVKSWYRVILTKIIRGNHEDGEDAKSYSLAKLTEKLHLSNGGLL